MNLDQLNEHEYLSLLTVMDSAPVGLTFVLDPGLIEIEDENGVRTFYPHGEGEGFYEVVFNDYVAYLVRNESFTNADSPPKLSGNVETFRESAFLDFVRENTIHYPNDERPAHYSFLCQDQIIDVAAQAPPAIRVIPTTDIG